MTIFEELKERGLIFQTTDEEALEKALTEGPLAFYSGYDPTADSLHLGHLVPIIVCRHLQLAGHKPYPLVGGATGLIGDPSFKDTERSLQTKETVDGWVAKIQAQLSHFLNFDSGSNKAEMVNNYDWFADISFIDFLRDVGKYFTVNYMMSKESVKKRIETGISYTEFAYQIMQGFDFYELNRRYGVTLQIGGSDQWGNMTAGTELLRRKADKVSHVITVPLITDATGKKFGKSEGNAVWLDASKTSPYEMYQFWLNVMDEDAVRFLKIFTFLPLTEIEDIRKSFEAEPHKRLAQKVLAREVVTLVHGEAAYKEALNITEQLFSGNIQKLTAAELKQGLSNVPNYAVQSQDSLNIVDILVTSGIVTSKRQAREDLQNGAIYINGSRVQDTAYSLSDKDKIDNELTVIRRGKKKYFMITY
ncbi:tyrosine--tRNA ligase [Streptococcus pantholopis]|uniref:Tyrosine--tRNA ligase n=1 Tax=Streptococcus pantholopis TaxID=1811193 RepID=A0A172QA70_9STRE|nr:tyrosine--tRNA ligase [Streptococcus pantholopis]AND80332.1 tyrosine--tRNA ligase [Streptococcus pantholopis]